ncbi:hypothetical protein PTE30175_03031 [Pandoraea terrae]|uniref:Chemotaxis protein CheX n=1 Tax=Pandoraea terrae TaxID=1537710 RepID=A0A5E4WAL7_9BURK|nr:hypothetical protein [Pandoraea terrae]VVE20576.1 hypothetical protein PTE30175_03031 [Pandoraea terrae]
MISTHAKDSIERIFHKAARSRLPLTSGDVCQITPLTSAQANTAGDELAVLTISSILFRLVLILHFDEDDTTRAYFLKEGAEGSFREVFLEICNLCCGAMNQELLNYFPDLGMSTPYVLSAKCVAHLHELKPNHVASYSVTINDDVKLAATLCVCAHAPIDFHADVRMDEEASGELELF